MPIIHTPLPGCFVITPQLFADKRGYFCETFNKQRFQQLTGLEFNCCQDNSSFSTYGVLRGLHAQRGQAAQTKLLQVMHGAIFDAVVDLRPDSATFKQVFTTTLTAEQPQLLLIPKGCLHGFVVTSPTALVSYKCDNHYAPNAEIGVIYNDPQLNINWPVPDNELIVSAKDLALPRLANLTTYA